MNVHYMKIASSEVPYSDPLITKKVVKMDKGPFIQDIGKFFTIFDPQTPYRWQFFTTIRWQIWQVLDPSPYQEMPTS